MHSTIISTIQITLILPLLYLLSKPALNQEGEEIREGIELAVETDILVAKLYAILDVGISAICKF